MSRTGLWSGMTTQSASVVKIDHSVWSKLICKNPMKADTNFQNCWAKMGSCLSDCSKRLSEDLHLAQFWSNWFRGDHGLFSFFPKDIRWKREIVVFGLDSYLGLSDLRSGGRSSGVCSSVLSMLLGNIAFVSPSPSTLSLSPFSLLNSLLNSLSLPPSPSPSPFSLPPCSHSPSFSPYPPYPQPLISPSEFLSKGVKLEGFTSLWSRCSIAVASLSSLNVWPNL